MELKDLVGNHYLSGVDYDSKDISNGIAFILDGKKYAAWEDQEDGYRSCMRDLEIYDSKIHNTFNPVKVVCKMSGNRDTLEVIDYYAGTLIMEVGTDYSDSYYPSFVCYFDPRQMSVNNISIDDPFIEEQIITIAKKYNPNYGDDRLCTCGHTYVKHFIDDLSSECRTCKCKEFNAKKLTNEEFILEAISILGDIYRNSIDKDSRAAAWRLLSIGVQKTKELN